MPIKITDEVVMQMAERIYLLGMRAELSKPGALEAA